MAPRFDFSNITWKWVFISLLVFFIAQVVISIVFGIFGIVTLGIGLLLFVILKPLTYFVGGYITGYISSGVTLTEPAIGAVLMVVLGTIFDASTTAGGVFWMIISGILAFFLALYGAYYGERKQSRR